MSSGDGSDDFPMSTDMLEDICDDGQSHTIVNSREAWYKIRDRIKWIQTECEGALLSTWNMGKGLCNVFGAVVNEILQALPLLGKSGSEVSYFIPEPGTFSEVNRLSEDIKKPWQVLPFLGEYGSEVSYFIPEPINFSEVTRLSEGIKKPWIKETLKENKYLIKNQTFLV